MRSIKIGLVSLLLSISIIALCLTGCASTTGTAPAEAGKPTYNLVYQCAWGTGGGPYHYAETLSNNIVACSGGRVTMDCLATNSIVPTVDLVDAVGNGTIDCAQTAATNFTTDSLGLLSALPAGMTFDQYMGWYVAGEGQKILDEVMAQINPNVVVIPCGLLDSEILFHSTTPIRSIEDIKGLKIRGVSDWAAIETRLGASVVTMDGGDCYEAISRGTIDACEYSGPETNYAAGFQEVAPYVTVPGIHQSCAAYLFFINRTVWENMDEQTQNIIRTACMATITQNFAEDRYANAVAWQKFLQLEADGKLEIFRLSDEDLNTIREVSMEYYAEKCEKDELFAKVYKSQQEYVALTEAWSEAAYIGYKQAPAK